MPSTPPDAVDLIAQHWPQDGPHTADTIMSAALALSEIAEYLARATRSGKALDHASDGSVVVGRLATAAGHQQQALQHLVDWAETLESDPGLRHDNHGNANTVAGEAAGWLNLASSEIGGTVRALTRAQSALGHLYHG